MVGLDTTGSGTCFDSIVPFLSSPSPELCISKVIKKREVVFYSVRKGFLCIIKYRYSYIMQYSQRCCGLWGSYCYCLYLFCILARWHMFVIKTCGNETGCKCQMKGMRFLAGNIKANQHPAVVVTATPGNTYNTTFMLLDIHIHMNTCTHNCTHHTWNHRNTLSVLTLVKTETVQSSSYKTKSTLLQDSKYL
jgi:hypothetical protein